ncbi:Ionotropic receptor 189, partial [Hyalella azteca]
MALSGRTLLVAVDTWEPYVSFPREAETNRSHFTGAAADAFTMMANKLNFTFRLVRCVDGIWGTHFGNGTFNGMIGMVVRGEVDMALGPFIQTHERNVYIDFSDALVTDGTGIFLPRPGIKKDLSNFLKPFSVGVWTALLISVLVSSLMAIFLRVTEKKFEENPTVLKKNPENFPSQLERVRKTVMKLKLLGSDWVFPATRHRATAQRGKLLADRVLRGTWLLMSVVLGAAYCGALTSLLAAPYVRIPVNSLHDLVKSDIKFASEVGSAVNEMLNRADSGVMMEVAKRMSIVESCYNSRFDIKSGNLAVLCDYISMTKVISEEFSENASCSYYIARERFSTGSLSFVFPKKSYLKPIFDKELNKMIAGGMISELIQRYTPNSTACLVAPGSEPGRQRVFVYTVKDLGGVFILL